MDNMKKIYEYMEKKKARMIDSEDNKETKDDTAREELDIRIEDNKSKEDNHLSSNSMEQSTSDETIPRVKTKMTFTQAYDNSSSLSLDVAPSEYQEKYSTIAQVE